MTWWFLRFLHWIFSHRISKKREGQQNFLSHQGLAKIFSIFCTYGMRVFTKKLHWFFFLYKNWALVCCIVENVQKWDTLLASFTVLFSKKLYQKVQKLFWSHKVFLFEEGNEHQQPFFGFISLYNFANKFCKSDC